MFSQPVCDHVNAALMLTPIDDPMAFFFGQRIELLQQSPVQGRSGICEQVHEHRPARGDLARLKCARSFVAFQIQKLKPVREWH